MNINKKSKEIKKACIKNYFKSDPVYRQRLAEEFAEINVEKRHQSTPLENVGVTDTKTDEFKLLEQKHDDLVKKCKDLEERNTILSQDNRALKKLLDNSKSLNLVKDLKIQQLKKSLEESNRIALQMPNRSGCMLNACEQVPDTCEQVPNTLQQAAYVPKSTARKMLFTSHEKYFNENELFDLRSHKIGKPRDASFIVKCVQYLYHQNMDVISRKVAGERKIKGKTPITPEKLKVISEMLIERVEAECCDENTSMLRSNRVNRLVGDALYTLSTRRETSQPKNTPNSMASQFASQSNPQQQSILTQPIPSHVTMTIPTNFLTNQPFDAFNYVSLPKPFSPYSLH